MGRLIRKQPEYKKKAKAKEARKDSRLENGASPTERADKPKSRDAGSQRGPVTPKALDIKTPRFVTVSVDFLREVRTELKRVAWPSRQQTVGTTAVVLVLVLIFSFFLGAVDTSLTKMISLVLG